MQKLFGGLVFTALALSLPGAAAAQRHAAPPASSAKHELGVDLGVAYVASNAAGVNDGMNIQTPVDIRLGFVPRAGNKMMWEPRVTFSFNTVNTGGNTTYLFTPQVNLLYANSAGGHHQGRYFTGGAGLVMGDFGAGSGTALKLEGGIGWRKPWEGAAWRYEVGLQYVSSSDNLGTAADYIAIGGRIGISLWH
jgi:hypothetical protein